MRSADLTHLFHLLYALLRALWTVYPDPCLSCSDAAAELAFQVSYMNHSELESSLSALPSLTDRGRRREKKEGGREKETQKGKDM